MGSRYSLQLGVEIRGKRLDHKSWHGVKRVAFCFHARQRSGGVGRRKELVCKFV